MFKHLHTSAKERVNIGPKFSKGTAFDLANILVCVLCFVFVFAILLLVVVCASFIGCVPVICPVSVFVTVLPAVGSQLILSLRRRGEVMYWRRGALVGLLVTLCCCVVRCCCAWCWQSADLILSLWRRGALVGLGLGLVLGAVLMCSCVVLCCCAWRWQSADLFKV